MPSIFHQFEAQFREIGGHKLILRSLGRVNRVLCLFKEFLL